MNLQTYPMDKHVCYYTIRTRESHSSPGQDSGVISGLLCLVSDPIERVRLKWIDEISHPIDNLLDSSTDKRLVHKSEFTPSLFNIRIGKTENYTNLWFGGNYSFLSVEFIFERTITANILTVYIPSSLVVTLSWIQFWFDVEAVPGRMSLGMPGRPVHIRHLI